MHCRKAIPHPDARCNVSLDADAAAAVAANASDPLLSDRGLSLIVIIVGITAFRQFFLIVLLLSPDNPS
jgi:hypothetical protein